MHQPNLVSYHAPFQATKKWIKKKLLTSAPVGIWPWLSKFQWPTTVRVNWGLLVLLTVSNLSSLNSTLCWWPKAGELRLYIYNPFFFLYIQPPCLAVWVSFLYDLSSVYNWCCCYLKQLIDCHQQMVLVMVLTALSVSDMPCIKIMQTWTVQSVCRSKLAMHACMYAINLWLAV